MKKVVILIMVMLGGEALVQSVGAEEAGDELVAVDYLNLTRANLPHVAVLQAAVQKNLDFDSELLEKTQQRIHRSALLPYSVEIGYFSDDGALYDYGLNDGGRKLHYTSSSGTGEYSQFGTTYGRVPNELSDKQYLSLSMRWDLADIFGYNVYELSAMYSKTVQNDQKSFAIVEVARRYAKLMEALPEEVGETIPEFQVYVIYENAGILDSLSGLLITKALRAEAEQSRTNRIGVVERNSISLKQEVQQTKAALNADGASVAEVADGQDDNVEIIGGEEFIGNEDVFSEDDELEL